jgi:hypothetical protein
MPLSCTRPLLGAPSSTAFFFKQGSEIVWGWLSNLYKTRQKWAERGGQVRPPQFAHEPFTGLPGTPKILEVIKSKR